MPAGCKSMAFKMTFQSSDRTLTETEVNSRIDEIRHGLDKRVAGQLPLARRLQLLELAAT